MLLAIDIGNSNIVFGICDEDRWVRQWRLRTDPFKMPDEYSVLFRDLLREENIVGTDLDQVIMSSVVPSLTGKIQEMTRGLAGQEPLIVGPGVKTGIKINIANPSELGTDIICNCVAAYERFKSSCIVVDFGTALTFTGLSDEGEFLGVAIAPGFQSAAEALSSHTAQLPQVWLEPPEKVLGRNTIQSIQSGVIYGYTSLVENMIDRIKKEIGKDVPVIATGGRANVVAKLTDRFTEKEPWLILEGLKIIAKKNRR
ncbi:type III pantothenate kinase [Spirochaeta cellobiosiphila]|uniref:type III pantothenate kinase n=1 Tax=Spirochaeta cellobiosiphila TaxID=504483 RepID=UPI0003F63047|nr:type III pantothenate kinase [Spirochaeta cellobiosiphila]